MAMCCRSLHQSGMLLDGPGQMRQPHLRQCSLSVSLIFLMFTELTILIHYLWKRFQCEPA